MATKFRQIVDACGVVLRSAGFERQPTYRFVRDADEGVVQLVEFQTGRADESIAGQFTAHLAVFVPEVYETLVRRPAPVFVGGAHCHIRATLGNVTPGRADTEPVWHGVDETDPGRFAARLRRHGLALFARLGTRATILANAGRYELDHWVDRSIRRRARDLWLADDPAADDARRALDEAIARCARRRGFHGFVSVDPAVCAIILARQGKARAARGALLRRQRETDHRGHARHLAELAVALGLRPLPTAPTPTARGETISGGTRVPAPRAARRPG